MYELIGHRKLDVAAATITFSNIPQNYSDLLLKVSLRASSTSDHYHDIDITFNGESARSWRGFYGLGTTAAGNGSSSFNIVSAAAGTVVSANTFSSTDIFISNYTSAGPKAISSELIVSNNSTSQTNTQLAANFITNSAAVTELTLFFPFSGGNTFTQHSSATLYGVNRTSGIGRAPLAMGGYMSYSNGYWVHTFPSSGSFIPFTNMDVEYLVIAGGGAGGGYFAGGGGAGGYRSSVIGELSGGGSLAESRLSLTANTNYPVTVGAGGSTGAGSNSVFSTITATGGGRGGTGGGNGTPRTAQTGGSGGAGGSSTNGGNSLAGAAGTANQGYAGGSSPGMSGNFTSGGGGGAGGAGVTPATTTSNGGNGGAGVFSSITGSSVARAGGGGGSVGDITAGTGSAGGGNGSQHSVSTGGVTSNGSAGSANTGGGGGGGGNTAVGSDAQWAGGSGIVIVRYRA